MLKNELCPQDYLDMIGKFIEGRAHVKKQQILNYCLKHTKDLDPGDEEKISDLIDAVINLGLRQGALARSKLFGYYYVNGKIEGTVGPTARQMKPLDQDSIKALFEIGKKASLQIFNKAALRENTSTIDQPVQVLDDDLLNNIPLEK